MSLPQWIDSENIEDVDGIGFLVERTPHGGESRWYVCDRPARTNGSAESILNGWCGETNNVNVYARGLVRIGSTSRNNRTRITPITDQAEIADALDTLCYPELV